VPCIEQEHPGNELAERTALTRRSGESQHNVDTGANPSGRKPQRRSPAHGM
jgi:hypothetical protein